VLADRGYDHEKYRRELRARGVKPVIARRNTVHGSGLGKEGWVVERTFAWLHNLRRLRIRYERTPICTWRSCCSAALWSASTG
jgi:transposase